MNPSFEHLLHRVIIEHAYPKYVGGHLRSAVLDAFIAVFDLIRDRSGLALDGADLVGRAFSLTEPRLIVSELETESGRNDQKGFLQLLQGAYTGIRNPKAHSLRTDLTPESTAQYLVFASLLARRIEAAHLGCFLRFDGPYVAFSPATVSCLRFFEDGCVHSMALTSDPTIHMSQSDIIETMDSLSKERFSARASQSGTFIRNGKKIEFATHSSFGEVRYSGEIEGEKLHLHIHSLINGNCFESDFIFQRAVR